MHHGVAGAGAGGPEASEALGGDPAPRTPRAPPPRSAIFTSSSALTRLVAGVAVEGRPEEVVVAVAASESVTPSRFAHLLHDLRCTAFTLAVVEADSTVSYYKVRCTLLPTLLTPTQIHDSLVSPELRGAALPL